MPPYTHPSIARARLITLNLEYKFCLSIYEKKLLCNTSESSRVAIVAGQKPLDQFDIETSGRDERKW